MRAETEEASQPESDEWQSEYSVLLKNAIPTAIGGGIEATIEYYHTCFLCNGKARTICLTFFRPAGNGVSVHLYDDEWVTITLDFQVRADPNASDSIIVRQRQD